MTLTQGGTLVPNVQGNLLHDNYTQEVLNHGKSRAVWI